MNLEKITLVKKEWEDYIKKELELEATVADSDTFLNNDGVD